MFQLFLVSHMKILPFIYVYWVVGVGRVTVAGKSQRSQRAYKKERSPQQQFKY